MKLWILTNTPAPYQVDFFNVLGRSGRAEVSVRHLRAPEAVGSWWPPRQAAFHHRTLRSITPGRWPLECQLHPGAIWDVLRGRYDTFILSGQYTSPTFVMCAVLLWLMRRRWAIWAERPSPGRSRPDSSKRVPNANWATRRLRGLVLSALVRMAPRIFCIGTVAIESYGRLGAKPDKLVLLPYMCDLVRYESVDPRLVVQVRKRLGLEEKFIFLFSGQMIIRKGVDVLLAAFTALARQRDDVALVLLGEGPLRSKWEAGIKPPLDQRVRFLGQVDQRDLPSLFCAADAMVFPSRYDGWAVVINEAAAAALPIITTGAVGAARDLVVEGSNGFIVPADDSSAVLEKMRFLAENPETAKRLGGRSRQLVERFSPENGAERLLEALGAVTPAGDMVASGRA